jgi:hypothetical protein
MGSSGKKHPQHLPKVGTPDAVRREQHEEREAVLGNFGVHPGQVNPILKWIVIAVIVMLAVGGALSLALLG